MPTSKTQQEQYTSLLQLIEAASKLTPEEEEQKGKLADLRAEAKSLYKEKASRAEWLSLAETVGNALTKIGAASAGMRAGVPVSTELFAKPTDWDAKIAGYQKDYLTESLEIGEREKELRAGPKLREAAAAVVGKEGLQLERPERAFPSQQAQYETPEGQPLSYDPNTDQYKVIGTGKVFTGIPRQRYEAGREYRPPIGAGGVGPTETPKHVFDILPPAGKRDIQASSKDLAREIKDIKTAVENLQGIDIAIDKALTNPIAAAQLGVRVAKALGEVGNLSQSDVTRYVERKGLPQKYADLYREMVSGTITKEKASEVKEALSIVRQAMEERIPARALEHATVIGTRYGMDPKLLVPLLWGGAAVPAKGAEREGLSIGTVDGGYEYVGGDPGNPASWEKLSPQETEGK